MQEDKNKKEDSEKGLSPLENISPKEVDEIKKKLDKLKAKIELFKKNLLKKFDKYITGVALLPPKRPEHLEKNMPKEAGEEKTNTDQINVLVLVDDADSKRMSKDELKDRLQGITDKIAKEIDKNFSIDVVLSSELMQNCYDCKYEMLEDIALSLIIHDPKDMLAALKISEIHKQMVLKKFERYIVSYIVWGSFFRGEKASNDIDVAVIVDDTDVKRMSRLELKDKLRLIIMTQGMQASDITGIKKKFHIQVYILTDFWEGIKDANPVFFTALRDGIPLYDRGVFMPWKLLLQMGRIKPSAEAIDMFMSGGEKILERVKFSLKEIVERDIYWATISPSQAALMLYGIPPPTPKETIQLLDDIFVKKEKLLEKRYVNILREIYRYYKGIEHETIKDVSGKDIDKLLNDSQEFLKRIRKLFDAIQKRKEKESILEIYDGVIAVTRDALRFSDINVSDVNLGLKKLVNEGELPEKLLRTLNSIIKAKKDYTAKKLTKQEIEKARKDASWYIRVLTEYIQRKRGREAERATIRIKYGDKFGEVILLDKEAYIVEDIDNKESGVNKAKITDDGGLVDIEKSDYKEMEKKLVEAKIPARVFIKEKLFEDLRKLFGSDVEVLVTY